MVRFNRQQVEGMQIGIAIDGSASMQPVFGAHIPQIFRRSGDNDMEPIIQRLCSYACGYSNDGRIQLIYWAVGNSGEEIELIGKIDASASQTVSIEGPSHHRWGRRTCLLPALNYFLSEFATPSEIVLLFITDGVIGNFDAVVARSIDVGREIVNGKRGQCKFFLVGFGDDIDEQQIERMDILFDGTELEGQVDLWGGELAATINDLADIWSDAWLSSY